MSDRVPPPPPRKSRLAAPPPEPTNAPDNLSKPSDAGVTADMNFKVSPSFHRRFKLEALVRGLSMKDLMEACFQAYLEKNGGTMDSVRSDLL